jgi:hypothetical protein
MYILIKELDTVNGGRCDFYIVSVLQGFSTHPLYRKDVVHTTIFEGRIRAVVKRAIE